MADQNLATGFDFGQSEPLTTRLKTLVRDYPEGLGIVKELLQNADDSRARRLHLIFDWRTHPTDQLQDPRMAQLQGPALLACNDRAFTQQDFTNITNLSSAGKLRDATKTGRFGQGFNSVYNLTDFPCFVTADQLTIFDPHRMAVGNPANGAPGRAWKLSPETWRTHGQLLDSFAVGGLSRGTEYFDRTIFRLPFRNAAQAQRSEIARKTFDHENAEQIIAEVLKTKEQLLLFLKFLEEFRVSQIGEDGTQHDVLVIVTENTAEVQDARTPLIQALEGDLEAVLDRLENDAAPKPSVFTHRFNVGTPTGSESVSWQIVSGLFVDEGSELLRTGRELQQDDERAVPWAGVAACLDGSRLQENGLAYCSLPLPIESGLPVHLLGQTFDLFLFQAMLFNQFEDQFSLLVRTNPMVTGLLVDRVVGVELTVGVGRSGGRQLPGAGTVHAVTVAVGQKADLLDLVVDALLEQGVQPRTFRFDLREVREFCADADDVRVIAVVGQPQLFAVGRFEDDCHRMNSSFPLGEMKSSLWGRPGWRPTAEMRLAEEKATDR